MAAAPPWLLLFLWLCWPTLCKLAYPTNQPHQVKLLLMYVHRRIFWRYEKVSSGGLYLPVQNLLSCINCKSFKYNLK